MVSQFVIPSKATWEGASLRLHQIGCIHAGKRSKKQEAVLANISIIRAFAFLRQFARDYKEIKEKIEKLEKDHNAKFEDVFRALNYLLSPKAKREQIGFKISRKE